MTHCLEGKHLAFAYEPGQDILTDVDIAVRGGEVVGIVGPNGAGKSTLLRVLCGLLRTHSGQVRLDDKVLASFSSIQRARVIAFLPQTVNPVFSLTVFEVICLGRYPHVGALGGLGRHDLEVAERCLREANAEELRDRDFMTLSGGERQRVLLASILAQEPSLLLLDEPTSALDIHHQTEFFALLRRLCRKGYGIGVVTHDLNLAARFCDRLILLSIQRRLLAQGTPIDVLTEDLLSQAYSARIRVGVHPLTNTPLVTADAPEEEP
ncbi:MAG: ABC transporter ATP-binding protein [Candidatus Hydrogenedentes bacterium]|nr:ABC transporter ATP-binding protein [Candidatus Hydrogenedentota bacterium]